MGNKYLIINADDCGLCASANKAVFELFEGGYLKSSTIMMMCQGAEEAVRFSVENPQYAMGVHLTTTCEWSSYRWSPLSDGATLRREDGTMWNRSEQFSKYASLGDTRRELQAQLDKARRLGMKPSHLDNHMGSLYGNRDGRFTMLATALKFCADTGYAFRLYSKADRNVVPRGTPYALLKASTLLTRGLSRHYGVIIPDYLLFPDWEDDSLRESYEHYREVLLDKLVHIPYGITETFVHPCVEGDDIKDICPAWQDRVWEYRVMKDPVTHECLRRNGIELISYRDLVRMKKR